MPATLSTAGLGTGTIVGIVAGILGGALIMSLVIILYLIRKKRISGQNAGEGNIERTVPEADRRAGNLEPIGEQVGDIPEEGGRLRYPNENIEASGRLDYPN